MSTLNQEVARLQQAKSAIDEVLIARGVTIPENATLDTYYQLIESIKGGTSSEEVTATKANVLVGTTTITADSGDEIVEGTMPNNSGQAKGTDNVYFDDSYMQVTIKYPGYYDENSTIRIGKDNLGNATADKVLDGITYSSSEGLNLSGNIPIKSADTYFASTNDLTIDAGQYLGGTQTIKGLAQTNFSPANIKTGVTVKINNGDRDLFSATGTYTNDADATSANMLNGKTAYVKGEKVTGTIPTRTSWTYDPSQTDEYGAYQISTDDTNSRMYVRFPGDTYYAYSIVDGKKRNPFVYIPYSSLSSVLGIEAGKMLTTETIAGVTGTIPVQGAKTSSLNCGGSYTIPAGYHNGSGKITANSLADQTKVDSGKTAVAAAQMLSGYQGYVNGSKISGTMTNQGAQTKTITPSSSTQTYTIPAGYHNGSGKVTVNGYGDKYTLVVARAASDYTLTSSYVTIASNVPTDVDVFITGSETNGMRNIFIAAGDTKQIGSNAKYDSTTGNNYVIWAQRSGTNIQIKAYNNTYVYKGCKVFYYKKG